MSSTEKVSNGAPTAKGDGVSLRRQQINIALLAIGSTCVFTAQATGTNILELVVSSLNRSDHAGGFYGMEGYYATSLMFFGGGLSQPAAPLIDSFFGERGVLLTATALFIAFLVTTAAWPRAWLLLTTAAIAGIGIGQFANAQFTTVARNSPTPEAMQTNSLLVWGIAATGYIFGNLLVYFRFQDVQSISPEGRELIYWSLSASVVVAALLFALLRNRKFDDGGVRPVEAALLPFRMMMREPIMHWLMLPMLYTGFNALYMLSVFGSSIGFTRALGSNSRADAGLAQIVVGLGEIGVAVFVQFAPPIRRRVLVFSGAGFMASSLVLSLLVLPWQAPLGDTDAMPLIGFGSAALVFVVALLMGIGDALMQGMFLACVGDAFGGSKASSGYAVYWICQGVFGGLGFLYATRVGLEWQLGVMLCGLAIGLFGYAKVERLLEETQATSAEKILY